MANTDPKTKEFGGSEFKRLPVSDKFKKVFNKFRNNLIIILAVVLVIDLTAVMNLRNIYSVYYEQNSQQGEIRITIQALAKYYLWAMNAIDEADRQEQLAGAQEKIDEMNDGLTTLSKVYNGDLATAYAHVKDIDDADENLKTLMSSGASREEVYSYYVGTVNEAIKVVVKDFKEIGLSAKAQARRAFYGSIVMVSVMTLIALFIVVYAIIYSKKARAALTKSILGPIDAISVAADDMAKGKLEINIETDSEDELGKMADDLQESTSVIANIVTDIEDTLRRMSGGDFSSGSQNEDLYIGDYEAIKNAFSDISENLSSTLLEVKNSSSQVSQGASNM
ncbi:MAG: methyl-accepting chemotaxis protein, partial [Butyrivibrio sp.]|nr:methyl-accepting chemotaxis protein [Butyrivibrio sp.]